MTLLLWLACAAELPNVHVRYDTGSFFTHPWPSNTRMSDGHPDLSTFPNPTENPLIGSFLEEGRKLKGFGTNSPIYIPLNGPLDTSLLPSPSQSLGDDSTVYLLNIDLKSPFRGEMVPVQWHYQEEATNWQPEHFLSIAPVWGFPLRADTEYALILTTELVGYSDGLPELWKDTESLALSTERRDHEALNLIETWIHLEYDADEIADFTIFTTQDPIGEMVDMAHRIDAELSIPTLSPYVDKSFETPRYTAYDGRLRLPLWQYGIKPYSSNGGGFAFEEDGRPIVFGWDDAKFRISVPNDPMPEDGWPVAIYSHGTGGNYATYANATGALEPAKILADAGFMGIGISQPIHAERGTGADPEIYSFNYLNPTSARSMFRQGALDQIYLAKLLSSAVQTFDLGTEVITTNPDKLVYVGHSHGGEVGAIALPFMGQYIQAAVLSGAGGGLSVTLMEREQAGGINIQELLRNAIGLAENEEINPFHPAVGLVQMLAEVVDPINYARYWFQEEGYWSQGPTSILMTEGMSDQYTPPPSIEILAAGAGIPIIGEAVSVNTAQSLLGLPNPEYAQWNSETYLGTTITTGLVQYPEDGHFAIFYNDAAGRTYRDFLAGTLDDGAVILP